MKNKIYGWKSVFSFTFVQTMKSKSTKISLIILFLFALLSLPISALFSDDDDKKTDKKSSIEKIYFFNETTYTDIDFSQVLLSDDNTKHITIENCSEDYDDKLDFIEENEHTSIAFKLLKEDSAYSLDFVKPTSNDIKTHDVDSVCALFSKYFSEYKNTSLSIDAETLKTVSAPITTKVTDLAESNNDSADTSKDDESQSGFSMTQYWITYVIMFIIFFITVFSCGQISVGIATDKSTRVVEYLLTSIKPLALIIGKILSMLLFCIIEITGIFVCILVSNIFTTKYISSTTLLSKYLTSNSLPSLNPGYVIIAVILGLLGMIFYATLAGLAGATVSKLEDLKDGLTLYNMVLIAGFYLGFFVLQSLTETGINSFATFVMIFPLSSSFILPGIIFTGKVSILVIILSTVVLILSCILILLFTAKVYEALIMYNGNRIRLKDIIQIAKGGKKDE